MGGIGLAVLTVGHQVVSSIETHSFAVGHDFSSHAVDSALTKGTANEIIDYLDLLAGLALTAGMIVVMVNALRVGLLPRWMGILGIFTGVLIFLPIGGATLEVVPAFWMVAMGILYCGQLAERRAAGVGRGRGQPMAFAGGTPRRARRAASRQAGGEGPAGAVHGVWRRRASPGSAGVQAVLAQAPAQARGARLSASRGGAGCRAETEASDRSTSSPGCSRSRRSTLRRSSASTRC